MKGSRKAVLCFWDGSDDFGESTLPVCLQSQTPGISQAVPLSLRKNAKGGGQSAQLAFGSDSRPCRNNAVSRSPSSNHPSSAAARPDATFLWLTLPTDRKKHAGYGSGLGVLS